MRYDSDTEMLSRAVTSSSDNNQKQAAVADINIKIKTNGTHIPFIGSLHPATGLPCEWVNNNPHGEQSPPPISNMPKWLLTLLLRETSQQQQQQQLHEQSPLVTPQQYHHPHQNLNVTPKLDRDALVELVRSLKVERSENYYDWCNVVAAIKEVSDKYYDIAEMFSRGRKNESELQKVWNRENRSAAVAAAQSLLKW